MDSDHKLCYECESSYYDTYKYCPKCGIELIDAPESPEITRLGKKVEVAYHGPFLMLVLFSFNLISWNYFGFNLSEYFYMSIFVIWFLAEIVSYIYVYQCGENYREEEKKTMREERGQLVSTGE